MEMEEEPLNPQDVERARTFWCEEDVDQVFHGVYEYLDHLKRVLKKNTATDKEYVQGLKLLECLNCPPLSSQDSSVVQVVIGSGELLPADFTHHSSSSSSTCTSPVPPSVSTAPPTGREELLPPLTPIHLQYLLHPCSQSCLPSLPSMPQCAPAFWGQNPLKVPLLCGFKRLSAMPMMSSRVDGEVCEDVDKDVEDWDVVYKAPCGQSLRNHDDVMRFLLATESYDILQVDFFTFNPSVRLDPPPPAGPQRPEMDLSRGAEPTPVQLCIRDGSARPADFRYRKDRWPHGCFLTRSPALFDVCCDCTDGCSDAQHCACVAMTTGGRSYSHHRLIEPVPSGVYECGPWCGCVRARCQNRLVQFPLPEPQDVFLAAQVKFDDLNRDLRQLGRDLTRCEKDVQNVCSNSPEENLQPFKDKMEAFVLTARKEHAEASYQLMTVQKSFQDLVLYFGLKPKMGEKDVTTSFLFMLWFEFCADFKARWKRENKTVSKERLKEAQQSVKRITSEKKVETRKINPNSLKERLRQKEASMSST